MMRIGIYEGYFSPPHKGHVAAAKAFMEQMWLDILYVLPLPASELYAASPQDRMEMCRLAFSELEGVCVSDARLRDGEKGSTEALLRELSGEERRLFLLLGTDTMLSLDRSTSPQDIFTLSYPAYVRREASDPILDQQIVEKLAAYQRDYGRIVRRILTDPVEISSEEIRSRVTKGEPLDGLLSPAVEKYIRDKHLYG